VKLELNNEQFGNIAARSDTSSFATAIGLALRGLQKNKLEINLLPLSKRVIKKNYNMYIAMVLSAVLVLLIIFSVSFGFYNRWAKLQGLKQKIAELEPQVNAITRLKQKNEQIDNEIEEFKLLYQDNYPLVDILKELSKIIPETAWVNSMQVRGSKLSLSGYSDSPEDLPKILDSSKYFEEVKIVQIVKDRFSIEAQIQKLSLLDEMEPFIPPIDEEQPGTDKPADVTGISGKMFKQPGEISSDTGEGSDAMGEPLPDDVTGEEYFEEGTEETEFQGTPQPEDDHDSPRKISGNLNRGVE
jgi:Tfp pilus assembly protein PilN